MIAKAVLKEEETPHIKDFLGEKERQWLNKYYPPTHETPVINFGTKEPIYSQSFCKLVLRNHTAIRSKVKHRKQKTCTCIFD